MVWLAHRRPEGQHGRESRSVAPGAGDSQSFPHGTLGLATGARLSSVGIEACQDEKLAVTRFENEEFWGGIGR